MRGFGFRRVFLRPATLTRRPDGLGGPKKNSAAGIGKEIIITLWDEGMAGQDDPRVSFVSSISASETRVSYSHPIVFFCGGRYKKEYTKDDATLSFRDAFRRYIQDHHSPARQSLVLADDFEDWLNHAIYPDLVTFERDIAGAASLSVIVVEAPGALAELGAFTQLPELQKKLVIVVPYKYREEKSFIKHGILRFASVRRPNCVYYLDWDDESPEKVKNDVLQDFAIDLDDELKKATKPSQLRVEARGHQMILISALIETFLAVSKAELKEYLHLIGCNVAPQELMRMTFCLEKLGVIHSDETSNRMYFLKGKRKFHEVDFRYKSKARPFRDRDEVTLAIRDYVDRNTEERHRRKVIQRNFREGGSDVFKC